MNKKEAKLCDYKPAKMCHYCKFVELREQENGHVWHYCTIHECRCHKHKVCKWFERKHLTKKKSKI